MGSFDGAEICELVGLYILSILSKDYGKDGIGLYRDDGLAVFKSISGSRADRIRKSITRTFQKLGLHITIVCNLKITNFLDITFNLSDGKYYPYRKPNDCPMYIHKLSNHPPSIIKNLPASISRRIADISCDEETFNEDQNGGDPTPCGKVILLDADQPTVQITDERYRLGGTEDDATNECLWYFRGPPGTTIRLDIVALEPMTEPFIVYDGLGIETDNDQGIQLGGRHGNSFISNGRGLTCKLPTKLDDIHQETSVTMQATLQEELSIEGAIPGECGGTINLDQTSPISHFNVTNSYPSGVSASCNWYINSPPNTMIVVEFYDWQLIDDNDYLSIYDSRGRQIFYAYGKLQQAPHPVISDSSARVYFNAYYNNDVSDSYFGVKFSYIDGHNDASVLQSSGGVIELNENTTSLTVQSMYFTSTYYVENVNNYWFVTSPVGRRIKVEFHKLKAGHFYVYDSSNTSGIVSRFSNPSIMPEDRVFSQNTGTLYFQFSGTYGGVGLQFTISITDEYPVVGQQTCGGRVELDQFQDKFIFISPYYYGQSVRGETDCYWYVTSPAGKQVQLEWLDIDTSYEYVRVYDHPSSQSYPVSQFRGEFDPDLSPFVSTRGGITFMLDDYSSDTNGRGFRANVSLSDGTSVVGPGSCGGTIRLSKSMPDFTLNSPHYYQPSSYESNTYIRCYWCVHAPLGQEVELTWLDIDYKTYQVMIYDYPSSTNYIVSSIQGDIDVDISPVVSSRGGWTVQHTDKYTGKKGRGFLAEFSLRDTPNSSSATSCGGMIPLTQSSPHATFSIPYYYQSSRSSVFLNCYWYITSPSGKQVQLTVLDLETGSSERIYIYDHPTSISPSYQVSYLSGRLESPATVLSSRGGVIVRYYDYNSGYNGPGILFEARILDAMPSEVPGFCGGVIPLSTSTPRVTTTTPLYHKNSESDVTIDCWWYVRSPSGKQVEMRVHDLQTENEYVTVYDYPSSSLYQVSDLRGIVSNSTVVSTRGGFSGVFNDTSTSRNGHGYAMDVALTDELSWDSVGIDSCGQTVHLDLSSPSIVFRTPTYPVEVVNDRYICYWYFTCPYGYRISLLFNDFDIFSGSRLRVYDASSVSSTYQLAEISSSSTPGSGAIQSSSNTMTLYYNDTDWSDVTKQRGILAEASIVSSGEPTWEQVGPMSSCGSAVSLSGQDSRITLTTPDYPDVNGDYYECTWFVECPSYTTVRIDFNDFWLDSNGYLRVYDGPNTGYSVIQHSTGNLSIPDSVNSSSNVMTVYYYNNRGTSGKGASFAISCLFEVNLECDSTSMAVFLDIRQLPNGTNAEDIHFEDEDCVGIDHDTTQIVLYTRYDKCSTRVQETETSIIYSNVVTSYKPRPLPGTEITRDNILMIPVKCELDRHRLLGDSFDSKIGEIVFNETGYGDFSLRLDRYTDATFDEFAGDDEGEIILGEHLYFAVNLTTVAGLTVFFENCWATPSQYPNDAKSYNFLDNGCSEDPTMRKLYSSDPSFSKFVIDAFTFIEENTQVFIHCEVLICNDNDPSSRCSQGCKSRFRRGSRHTRGTSSTPHLISNGPLSTAHTMHAAETHNSDGSPVGMESSILIGVLACITCLIVATVAGVLYKLPARRMSNIYTIEASSEGQRKL
ncbi:cubilin [Strongylocentrotus purpuratus]|uniref:Uncharacterized protein n=1 Tax=Strongylocentrotus purpuratus TaxID=7668 RepID=A0A7M7P390_STRPU|nr:cubilin [Strongylocentrotus purpuratus]